MNQRFDPNTYATVQERRKQFLADHPNGIILTDVIPGVSDFTHAVVHARVWRDRSSANPDLPDASGIASEWYVEYGTDEARRMQANTTSWWENAATSAIGRALVNLGYDMTKEAPSREEMDKVRRLDGQRPYPNNGNAAGPAPVSIGPDQPATPRQLRYLEAIAREAGFDMDALNARSITEFGVPANQLTRRDASTLIDVLPGSAPPQAQHAPANGALSQQVKQGRETAPPAPQNGQARPAVQNPDAEPSAKQWEFLDGLARAIELDRPTMDELAMLRYGTPGIDALTKGEASNLIDAMRQVRDGALAKESLWPEKPAAPKTAPPAAATGAGWDEPSPWDNAEPPF